MSWAIWITGPPGSGKSSVAQAAAALLSARGEAVSVLELDAIRQKITPQPQYTDAERDTVYRALGYMASVLVEAGVPVIVDATAHRRAWRDAARASIPRFGEVQIVCPLAICRERERARPRGYAPPGIYDRAGRPGGTVPGVDVPYEVALAPELIIDTTVEDVASAAARVVALAERLAASTVVRPRGLASWAIWITGRPGSGKTSLATRLAEALARSQVSVKVLDLASARRGIVRQPWASDAQEEIVHRALAYTAMLLTEAGVAVVLDATAPRRAWRDAAREWITHFAEVQLVCPAALCAAREQAARWALGGAARGGGAAAPDIALDYEESLHAELRLHTHAPELLNTLEEALLLARRLHRAATATITQSERTPR